MKTTIKVRLRASQSVPGSGGDTFTQLYSIVDTAKKHNQDPFLALIAVAQNVTK